MIRLTLLWLLIAYFSLFAFKDWFKSLCFLILLVGVVEHPDMPKTIFGVQGLNPWNVLLSFVLLGWLVNKQREGLKWELPGNIKALSLIYIVIMIVSFSRMITDLSGLNQWFIETQDKAPSFKGLVAEHFINTLKWIIPGILVYHGAKTKQRIHYAIIATLGIYLLLALEIIKAMPIGVLANGEELKHYSLKILPTNVGFHRVNLAMMMSGAFWAVFAFKDYRKAKGYRLSIYAACGVILLGLALTGGRTGYATMIIVGLALSFLKWRKNILLLPIIVIIIAISFPGSMERFTQGFDETSRDEASAAVEEAVENQSGNIDYYTVTAGRTVIWPYVLDKISDAPFFGYGKEAMLRTGLSLWLLDVFGEVFPHPHNMYMQWILDNGIVGFVPVVLLFIILLNYSRKLFSEKDILKASVGGATLSLVLALLVAGVGSQTFYPREGAVAMWCMIGIMLRVYQIKLQNTSMPDEKASMDSQRPKFGFQ